MELSFSKVSFQDYIVSIFDLLFKTVNSETATKTKFCWRELSLKLVSCQIWTINIKLISPLIPLMLVSWVGPRWIYLVLAVKNNHEVQVLI